MDTAKEVFQRRDELASFLVDHVHNFIDDSIDFSLIETIAEELIKEGWVNIDGY